MSDIDSMPGKLDALSDRVGRLETAMDENTTMTRTVATQLPEIKEMLTVYASAKTTGSVLTRLVRWIGGLATAVAAIVASWHLMNK